MTTWISVEDELPPEEKMYLAFILSGNIKMLYFDRKNGWAEPWGHSVIWSESVGYWMELPPAPPPKEQAE